jgi:hypothetical protein
MNWFDGELCMNSMDLLLGIVAVAMSGVAIFALHRARLTSAYCIDLELLIMDADQRLDDIETQILRLMKDGKQTAGQVDRLTADQGHLVLNGSGTEFGEAIALIQHGANAEQLINTCGISRAEAHLVETLYGPKDSNSIVSPDSPNQINSSNKFVLVNAHLEATEHRLEI